MHGMPVMQFYVSEQREQGRGGKVKDRGMIRGEKESEC